MFTIYKCIQKNYLSTGNFHVWKFSQIFQERKRIISYFGFNCKPSWVIFIFFIFTCVARMGSVELIWFMYSVVYGRLLRWVCHNNANFTYCPLTAITNASITVRPLFYGYYQQANFGVTSHKVAFGRNMLVVRF